MVRGKYRECSRLKNVYVKRENSQCSNILQLKSSFFALSVIVLVLIVAFFGFTSLKLTGNAVLDERALGISGSESSNITSDNSTKMNQSEYNTQDTSVSACGTLNSAGTVYTLTQNISSNGTCLTVGASNIVIDCAGYTISYGNNGTGRGVSIGVGLNNISIKNCFIVKNGSLGSGNYGIYDVFASGGNLVNNTIITNGTYNNNGIQLTSNYLVIANNTIITDGSEGSNYGIYFLVSVSSNCNVTGNYISTSGTSNNHGIAIDVGNELNLFSGNIIRTGGSDSYGILIKGSKTIFNSNILNDTVQWINWSNSGYSGYANFTDTTFATQDASVTFLGLFYANDTNTLLVDRTKLNITYNYVYLNSSSLSAMNQTANITFYNLPTNFTNPQIFRDGALCNESICYNFTSLNAGTIKFNVTGWSNYSVVGGVAPFLSSEGSGSGGGGGSACTDNNWTCLDWGHCESNLQNRTCISNCNHMRNESQVCVCAPQWSCSEFGSCKDGTKTRTCYDLNYCGTNNVKPAEMESCACTANWNCTEFGSCKDKIQTRVCNDLNYCGNISSKPGETRICGSTITPNAILEEVQTSPKSISFLILVLLVIGILLAILIYFLRKRRMVRRKR